MRPPTMTAKRWMIAVAVVAITAVAWRLLPFPSTRRAAPGGTIQEWSRTYRLLPMSRWRVAWDEEIACGPKRSARRASLVLVFFEVADEHVDRLR